MNNGLIRVYLASPYTHKDPAVSESRYIEAVKATATLSKRYKGYNFFSPIVHSHPLAVIGGLRGDWGYWRTIDLDWIDSSNELWILTLDGWEQSKGVTEETAYARATNKSVCRVTVPEYSVNAF